VRAILASQPELHSVVLDFEGVNFVDSQGAAKMSELLELTEANDVELRLARLKPSVAGVLAADGLIDRIGSGRIHGNVHRAVDAAQAADARRHEAAGLPAT
jgi:anti-anti-sigma factor